MKKNWAKKISAILILTILFSVTSTVSVYAEASTEEGIPDFEQIEPEAEPSDSTEDGSDCENDETQKMDEESAEDEGSGESVESVESSELDDIKELEADQDPAEDEESDEIYELTLQYDDWYAFKDFSEVDLSGYSIESITTKEVTSYQVSNGAKSSTKDTDIVTLNSSSDGLVATGVGKASVIFCREGNDSEGTNSEESESKIKLSVTVEPAALTVMLIAGQSNAEGYSSDATGYHPEDSVLCEEGEVYSTYAPNSASYGKKITGISNISACSTSNADSFVAGSLTGSTSIDGKTLVYPLDSLTKSGDGKSGMDSGLAYNWNRLSGEKVWVVNAGWSATKISGWIPGGSQYERALVVFKDAVTTAKAEISAGHYTAGSTLLFWLQGESDKSTSTSSYLSNFKKMYNGFENAGLGISYYGIIAVRASSGSYVNSDDIYMTGPRVAQYVLGNDSSYSKIYVVSNVNEQWVSNSGVKSYFQDAYGSSLSYPLRSKATISKIPTTVNEVHADIHYSQAGHNENGLTAAETMYQIVKSSSSSSSSVQWYDPDGTKLSNGTKISLIKNGSYNYVPVVSPLSQSKKLSVSSSGSMIDYDASLGAILTYGEGSGSVTATTNGASAKLTVSSVTAKQLSTPVLKSAETGASATTVKWGSISGASGYAVYRKKSSGSWSMLGTTTSTSYKDTESLSSGITYYYTVRAYRGSSSSALAKKYDSTYWSSYNKTGLKAVYLSTPKLTGAKTGSSSTTVSWNKVSGAKGYAVYRKKSGGSWSMLTTTTSTSYTDKSSLSNGKTYYYTVRAYVGSASTAKSNKYDAAYWSGYDSTGVKAVYLSTPKLSSAKSAASGTKISWGKVSGANGYAVYRKKSGGSWSMLTTTTSTSYTDKASLSGGKTYYYTARAYVGSASTAKSNKYNAAYWGGYNTTGLKSVYLASPKLKSAKSVASGTKISWGKVSGASGYAVYRKKSGGSWSLLTTTTKTSYIDKANLSGGKTYYYTVRAYRGSVSTAKKNKYYAGYWGGYNTTGVKSIYLSIPKLGSVKSASSGTKVNWEEVKGASGYAIYRKQSGGSWSMIGMITGTSYKDQTDLSEGKTYYYTVRAYKGDESIAKSHKYSAAYWGGYNSVGLILHL